MCYLALAGIASGPRWPGGYSAGSRADRAEPDNEQWHLLIPQAGGRRLARLLGPEHPSTLTAQANLAVSYNQARRTADAMAILERVAADRERLLGPEHPDTIAAY